jgi:hypothetical protein
MSKPYPWYYAVNDRPVQIVELPDGGCDALVFDFVTGSFVPDRSYFARVLETGIGKDVDQLGEAEFETLVAGLRRSVSEKHRSTATVWEATGDGELPYRAEIGGRTFTLRVNDFPAEPLYTLLVDGHEVEDLEDWPSAWVRPAG